jgi:hypothetical protein
MTDRSGSRRKHKRFSVEGIYGIVHFLSDLNIINISVDGAAIETTKRLDLNREYTFKIYHRDAPLCLCGLVVWSVLDRTEKKESGEIIPVYKAGIKFTDIMSEKSNMLVNFIEESRVITLERRLGGARCKIVSPKDIKIGYPYGYGVKNISLSGMEIETEYPFEPLSMVDMELVLDSKVVNIMGRIKNCVKVTLENFTKYDMGVEFVEVSDEDKKLLKRFLDTLEGS